MDGQHAPDAAPPPPSPGLTQGIDAQHPPQPIEEERAPEQRPGDAARSADSLYGEAMNQLTSGDWRESRKTFHRVLMKDPHYAKANFRMGQIALLNRNMGFAATELEKALADRQRLDDRERQLCRIGLAIAAGQRQEVPGLARSFREQYPGDPDLSRMANEFPGFFRGEGGGGRRRRD